MLKTKKLEISFGGRTLFSDVNLKLIPKNRYGLIGANGSGKSTLLKILAGVEEPSSGSVDFPPNTEVGFLKQDHYRYENTMILEVVMQGDARLWNAEKEKKHLLENYDDQNESMGFRLAELEGVIAERDGYSAEARAHKILIGLGIEEDKHYEEMQVLSGGYKLRVLLAQTLFSMPDIMLLDEPTNHLDIVAIHWLEKFLKNDYKGVLLVISHDQFFLNNVANHILDIDFGSVEHYTGNFEQFIANKALKMADNERAQEGFAKKTAHMQAFVDRFKAKASKAKQAQSRVKQIEKLRDALPDALETSRAAPRFNFGKHLISGKNILKTKQISKSYDDHKALTEVSFSVYRQDKIGIIGKNGIGKSTLLKILMQEIEPDSGTFEWGQKVITGYFPQDHQTMLDPTVDVYTWLARSGYPEERVRRALGEMLFKRDDTLKKIDTLSGGEAARLLFANISLKQPNLLVLDEPTNHLDLETIEALINALEAFEGTILLVSHNRHFLKEVCNRIILIEDNKITNFNYDEEQDMDRILDTHFNI